MFKILFSSLLVVFSLNVKADNLISFNDAVLSDLPEIREKMMDKFTQSQLISFRTLSQKFADLYSQKITLKEFDNSITKEETNIMELLYKNNYSSYGYFLAHRYLTEANKYGDNNKPKYQAFLKKSADTFYHSCKKHRIKESCKMFDVFVKQGIVKVNKK